ncbi:MAG: hypothetical protein Q8Q08_09800 [Candidatus Omnitrophota bacterium]|nr:hypothetical protein [Candidatus Omnitrophota bacterium]MDZ4243381.1 hypothetical protein [Candidatus Omnitrophota bacterium]
MESDDIRYQRLNMRQAEDWEARCTRCGACCGVAEGDPCEHVVAAGDGRYVCGIYENRFGLHRTRSGRLFRCVPIRDILHKSWPGDRECSYKKTASPAV